MGSSCDCIDSNFCESFSEFAVVTHALAQLKDPHQHLQSAEIIPVNSSNNTALRLASTIQNCRSTDTLQQSLSSHNLSENDSSDVTDGGSPPFIMERHKIIKELSVIHAIGFWANDLLDEKTKETVINALDMNIVKSIYQCFIEDHYDLGETLAGSNNHNTEVIHAAQPWTDLQEARRYIFLSCLRKRFGTLDNLSVSAPTMGSPLVLYITMEQNESNHTEELNKCSCLDGWKQVLQGMALINVVKINSLDTLRSVITKPLRTAIKDKSVCPTMVVVDAGSEGYLANGMETIKAVCDVYGISVHVEGQALSYLLANSKCQNVSNDIGQFVRESHSLILNIGSWFGRYATALVTFLHPSIHSKAEIPPLMTDSKNVLSSSMAFWYLLERINISYRKKTLDTLCNFSTSLLELLGSVHNLFDCKPVGGCGDLLLSYVATDRTSSFRQGVNRAMLQYFQERNPAMSPIISEKDYDSLCWLSFSPILVLANPIIHHDLDNSTAQKIAIDFIRTARICETVAKGKAVFQAHIRQHQDLEVEKSDTEIEVSQVYYSGIRVTPLGEVSPHGRWKRDKDMKRTVEMLTVAVADYLHKESRKYVHATVRKGLQDETSILFVGPILPDVTTSLDDYANGTNEIFDCSYSAAAWDLDDKACHHLALEAAKIVAKAVEVTLMNAQKPSGTIITQEILKTEKTTVNTEQAAHVDNYEKETEVSFTPNMVIPKVVPNAFADRPTEPTCATDENKDNSESDSNYLINKFETTNMECKEETTEHETNSETHGVPKDEGEINERPVVRIILDEPSVVHENSKTPSSHPSSQPSEDPQQEINHGDLESTLTPTPKKRPNRFWGMFFGDSRSDESSDSGENKDDEENNEDDYFRI